MRRVPGLQPLALVFVTIQCNIFFTTKFTESSEKSHDFNSVVSVLSSEQRERVVKIISQLAE